MGKDDDVDPDAETVMPAARREEPGTGTGTAVAIEAAGERLDGVLQSASADEVVVRAARPLPVDSVVTLRCRSGGRQLTAQGKVVWTRSQGASVAIGVAFDKAAVAREWADLLG